MQSILGTKIIKNPLHVIMDVGVESLRAPPAAHVGTQTGDADHKPLCFKSVGEHKWSTCEEKKLLNQYKYSQLSSTSK